MKTMQFENTTKLFEKIKAISFFERIFSWKKLMALSMESYNEFKSVDKEISSLADKHQQLTTDIQSLKSDLKHSEKSKTELQIEIEKLKEDIKRNNTDIQKKEKELGKLKESDEKNRERASELQNDIKILEAKRDELITKNTSNEKKITEFEKLEKKKQDEYEHKVTELNSLKKQLDDDRIRLQQERQNEIKDKLEKMKLIWKVHEISVEEDIKLICNKYQIEYVEKEKVPFKGKPDNTIKICGQYIIFDAKSPASEDIENFSDYVKNQAEAVKKYVKEKDVKKDIFLVIPSNTLEVIKQFYYNMADYNVYVVSLDSLVPVILSLQKIEDYEFAEKLSPEDRENICRVLAKFAHTTKRRIQVDTFFSNEFINILTKCDSLPKDILERLVEFEKSDKLNLPTEQRGKKLILSKDLKKDATKVKQMAEIGDIKMDIDSKLIDQIPLYKKKRS